MPNAYKEQQLHDALPTTSHDELARQHFVRSFKEHLVTDLHPGLKTVYEKRAKGTLLPSTNVSLKPFRKSVR